MNKKLSEKRLVRYVLAGVLSYALELSCLLALYKLAGLSAELSTAIAFWIGLTASFILQKLFAFRDYQKTVKAISHQVGAYAVLVGFNYLFTLALVAVFPSRWVVFSRTLALIITTAWNYVLYQRFIFSRHSLGDAIASATDYVSGHRRQIAFAVALSLPMLFFFWQYLGTGGNKTWGGDFDYYSQMYEAFRITVLKYHQLPLWNPWLAGGVPLLSNPQFGLISIQSVLVLPFGAMYGLKLAYVVYALIGFWGMYTVGRKLLDASKTRSALVGYIWVFSGFFAGHGVWHLTFTSFFFLPWLLYFIVRRRQKYSWLWLGIIESAVILSSIHYAFLIMTLSLAMFFVVSLARLQLNGQLFKFSWQFSRADLFFVLKAAATVIVLAGYQFYLTYHFESHNERLTNPLAEPPNSPVVLFESLFLPIGTLITHLPKTVWGWGEYSMYLGMGTGLALLVCLAVLAHGLVKRSGKSFLSEKALVFSFLVIGAIGASLALGDFSHLSPFYLLHKVPGFTQTRVPSRWLMMTAFSLLLLLLAWRPNKRLINVLLLLAVVELFVTNGPPRVTGKNLFVIPPAKFSATFSQYDNDHQHIGVYGDTSILHSYYYMTSTNTGLIYADDSLVNTLPKDPLLVPTDRCGLNVSSDCSLVQTHNAQIVYWSPNKIVLRRTAPGPVRLDMNVESGWRVNGVYPFASIQNLVPAYDFVLTDNASSYTLQYAPKLSPSWVAWRVQRL